MRLFLYLSTLVIIITGCKEKEIEQRPITKTGAFRSVSQQSSGIDFTNQIVQTEEMNYFQNQYVFNGSGIAVGDLNNDSLPDVYFSSNQNENQLYINKGNLKFDNRTIESGTVGNSTWATGVSIVDVNADGWNDIYVCHAGNYLNQPDSLRNELFINNGDAQENGGVPTFTESAKLYGLDGISRTVQAYFFDYDRDNDLDVYLVNHPYNFWLPIDMRLEAEKAPYPEETDQLHRNNGDGTFTDVTKQAGLINWAFGLSASVGDVNRDGWPDLYVCNDYSEKDELYINNQDGSFLKAIDTAMFHISNFSMGSDIADFNNDLLPDVMVVDMMAEDNRRKKINMSAMKPEVFWDNAAIGRHYQYMQNTLQLNNGNGTFSEVAELANVSFTDWSWSPLFADFDNDGLKDLFISNGIAKDVRNTDANKPLLGRDLLEIRRNFKQHIDRLPSEPISNYVYRNKGDLTFENTTESWGLNFKGFSTSAVYADLDLDGDLDLILNNVNDTASLFENLIGNQQNYIQFVANGPSNNPKGIGLEIVVYSKGESQLQYLTSGKGFQSGSDQMLHFGLGAHSDVDSALVTWPDGKVQILHNIEPNQRITLNYTSSEVRHPGRPIKKLLLTSVNKIEHTHKEQPYDDYQFEVLLPHQYSQLGPKVAIGDVNADGFEDLLICGASGQSTQLFLQNTNGSFSLSESRPWTQHLLQEDVNALLFDSDNDNDLDIYICSGSNQWEQGNLLYQDRLYTNDGYGNFTYRPQALPKNASSTSCAVANDFDSDGDLDLFIGSRLVPREYPTPASSKLLLNENGVFKDVTINVAPQLDSIGLVTDAVWVDLFGDKTKELVVVGEWMSLRFFEIEDGRLNEVTLQTGLASKTGWWYCLDFADLDNDGDEDLIVGNLGLNNKYKASTDEPFHVYFEDFDNNGTGDIVLSYEQNDALFTVRGRSCSAQQVPSIKQKFPTYELFGDATIEDVFGESLNTALHLKATTMASTVFWNNGDGTFSESILPNEAQLSVVNGVEAKDLNNDGFKDLMLAGNNYLAETETCRHDASIGCVLLNDGNQGFNVVPPGESGFVNVGDARDVQTFADTEGNQCIIVTNNDGPVSIYRINR